MVLRGSLLLAALLAASAAMATSSGNTPSRVFHPKVQRPPAGTTLSAVVRSDGSLVRGRNVTGSMHVGSGTEVDFISDVSQCAFVATIGQPGSKGSQSAGMISVVGRSGVPQGVYVETQTRSAHLKFLPFHIDVGC